MSTNRYFHTATLLPNGKVLIAGGYNDSPHSSAELYDPATGTWTATGAMGIEVRRRGVASILRQRSPSRLVRIHWRWRAVKSLT